MGRKWFTEKWPTVFSGKHINVLELFALAAALIMWCKTFYNTDLVVFTDNKPITQIWLSSSTINKEIMKILRCLFFFLAKRNINVRLEHIYGYRYVYVDSLSRLQVNAVKE